jgi:hypothetical protein
MANLAAKTRLQSIRQPSFTRPTGLPQQRKSERSVFFLARRLLANPLLLILGNDAKPCGRCDACVLRLSKSLLL